MRDEQWRNKKRRGRPTYQDVDNKWYLELTYDYDAWTAYNIDLRVFSDNGGKTWFGSRDSWKYISFPCKSKDLEPEYVILNKEK